MQQATKDTAAISQKPEVLVQSLSVSSTASEHAAVGTASSPNVSQQSRRPTASVRVQTPKKKCTASHEPTAWFLTYMWKRKMQRLKGVGKPHRKWRQRRSASSRN